MNQESSAPTGKGHSVIGVSEPIVPKPIKHERQRAKPKPRKKAEKINMPKGSGFQTDKVDIAEFLNGVQSTGDIIDAIMDSTPGPTIGGANNRAKKVRYPDPGKKVSKKKPSSFSQFAAETAVASLPTRKKPPPFRGA